MSLKTILQAMFEVGLQMQTSNSFNFNWRASYDRDFREMAIGNEPVFYVSFLDDGDEDNLDSQQGGGGAQNSEFADVVTMTVYSRIPWDFPTGNPVDDPFLNSEAPYHTEGNSYDGVQDIKQAFDINGGGGNPKTGDIICNSGVYDLNYIRTMKVNIEKENNYNALEFKSIFEFKYRTPRRR